MLQKCYYVDVERGVDMKQEDTPIFRSNQQLFEFMVTNLYKQGCKSEQHGKCKYRNYESKSCAVGFLIPDDAYDPEMEGRAAHALLYARQFERWGAYRATQPLFSLVDTENMLGAVQRFLHDEYANTEFGVAYLDAVVSFAETYGLEHTFVESLRK